MENLFEKIPPAQALQISAIRYADGCLELAAPLRPNLNDKGTVFAGSIASMLTLAGWGAVTLRLREAGIHADVMVVESAIRYRKPARTDIRSTARVGQIDRLMSDLATMKRGRIDVESTLSSDGKLCAAMTASFAVFPGGADAQRPESAE